MASALDVKVTANVVDLVQKFGIAQAQSNALGKTFRDTAREAALAGKDISDELKQKLHDAAEAFATAQAKAKDYGEQLKAARQPAQSFGEGLQVIKGGLAALGIGVSIEAVKAFTETVLENAAHLQHESEVLQLNVVAYQAFREAALDSGVEVGDADQAIMRFSRSASMAAVGSGTAAKAFLEMGIDANQSKTALLQQVAAFELHADAATRDEHAFELFGRTGTEMLPLFKEWAQGADVLADKFGAMGRIMDPETTERAHKADIAFKEAWDHMKVASAGPVADLYTALAGLLNQASGAKPAADEWSQFGAGVGAALTWPLQVLKLFNSEAAKVKPPTPKVAPEPPVDHSEAAEIKRLQALDPVQKERNDLRLQYNGLKKLEAQYAAEGHDKAAATAKQDANDIQKKIDALNKTKFGGGFSNEGDKEIADTEEKNEQIKASEQGTLKEIYDATQANWQKILDGHRLNAKQIDEVNKTMARETIQYHKAANQEADQIAKADVQMQLSLAKDAMAAKKSLLEEEFAEHKITAQQKYDQTVQAINAEVAAEKAAQEQIINSVVSSVVQKHQAMDQEVVLDAQKNAALAAAAKQLTQDLKQEDKQREESWRAVDSAITGAEGQLVNDIFTKRQSLATDLAIIGAHMLEQEVADDLKALTEHEMVNLGMLSSDKATAQEGLLFKLFNLTAGTAQETAAQTKQVAAVAAGQAAKNAATAAGAAQGKAIQTVSNQTTVSQDAATGAASAYKAMAGIPVIGPILGALAAAATFAAIEAWGSFDKGINVVPQDMIAQVHAGERIMPAADNRALMDAVNGGGGKGGGGDVHLTYAPVIHNSMPKSIGKMMEEQSGEFVSMFQSFQRDGLI